MLPPMNLGFIGLGKMGAGMARNLHRARLRMVVYKRSGEKAEAFVAGGASVADTPCQACLGREAVFTMLAADHPMEEIVFAESGLLSALAEGGVHIASTTMSTALARRLETEHARKGAAICKRAGFRAA